MKSWKALLLVGILMWQAQLANAQSVAPQERIMEMTRATALPSGPSVGYAARVIAAIKPNIVLEEDVAGNPVAEVEVRLARDGQILEAKLQQSSGNASWDRTVIRALAKTDRLPLDADGRVPPRLLIAFRPKE